MRLASITCLALAVFVGAQSVAPGPAGLFELAQALLFAGRPAEASPLFEKAVALQPKVAAYHLWLARSYAAEAKRTSNVMRLVSIGWNCGDELEAAVSLDPASLEARLDLVRYYVTAPALVGGSWSKARAQAAEIAKRDAALGAFADGYVAYRRKEYGVGRTRFRNAVRLAVARETKVLALTWLGYLSQETQQYDDAFGAFDEILRIDPAHAHALYEVGRTALFSGRDLDRGEASLKRYLTTTPRYDEPSIADAHLQLGLLLERKGDTEAARREVEAALRLDPEVEGGRAAEQRFGVRQPKLPL